MPISQNILFMNKKLTSSPFQRILLGTFKIVVLFIRRLRLKQNFVRHRGTSTAARFGRTILVWVVFALNLQQSHSSNKPKKDLRKSHKRMFNFKHFLVRKLKTYINIFLIHFHHYRIIVRMEMLELLLLHFSSIYVF